MRLILFLWFVSVTPCVVMLEYILDGKTLSTLRALTLVGVCFFVFLSSKTDLAFSAYGILCIVC